MKKLELLIIHCTATPPKHDTGISHILQWHMGPCDMPDGKVKYRGNIYPNRDCLPKERIAGTDVKKLKGRGWDRPGYSDLIRLDGELVNIQPFNTDGYVDYNEMTWGVAGENSHARHVVYAGGVDEKLNPKDTRTEAQIKSLLVYLKYMVLRHPHIQIGGHNQFANKACPSFDVPSFLKKSGFSDNNIYLPKK